MDNLRPRSTMAEQNKAANLLLEARPPVTDYLTYLTIIEDNLAEETLPVLHEVLQDTELTTHIGWDLVQLLLPLLPASEQCLEDVADRGNPRECILKVTEALRTLDFDVYSEDSEDEGDESETSKAATKATGKHTSSEPVSYTHLTLPTKRIV